ncbi:helix-turn-helix domain-containing protein [Candidatus Woesearchaeota archaeon]|nr:helix-turn-helix domain-containing protein [Candidatus Woesearchaeota archaeon]
MADKFIMVSLEEEKAKKLAEVISNDTARKILDYLSEKNEATASEISKDLNVPISTVDYNMKNLIENGLVESKEFRWSPKGRQMDIYKLANKHIIISTKKSSILKEKLKDVFIMLILGIGAAGLINYFYKPFAVVSSTVVNNVNEQVVESTSAGAMMKVAPEVAPQAMQEIISKINLPNVALWFLLGVTFSILIYLIVNWRLKK